MFNMKYFRIVNLLAFIAIFITIITRQKEEVIDVGLITEPTNTGAEIDYNELERMKKADYFQTNFTNLMNDGYRLKNNVNYDEIKNVLRNQKGLIIASKEFLLLGDLKNKPDFNFIPIDDNTHLVLSELSDPFYELGIISNKVLSYNGYNIFPGYDYYLSDHHEIEKLKDNFYYLNLYPIIKDKLESQSNLGYITYNIDVNDIKVYNDYNDINFRNHFLWKNNS
ncbi:MAG: hypothetical protein K0Q49_1154 [Haloplasmataceae bacterium]|nr:hypothetical protein [Haloplasmataceae bacterium]